MHDIQVTDIRSKAHVAIAINGMLADSAIRNVSVLPGGKRVQVNARTENVKEE